MQVKLLAQLLWSEHAPVTPFPFYIKLLPLYGVITKELPNFITLYLIQCKSEKDTPSEIASSKIELNTTQIVLFQKTPTMSALISKLNIPEYEGVPR